MHHLALPKSYRDLFKVTSTYLDLSFKGDRGAFANQFQNNLIYNNMLISQNTSSNPDRSFFKNFQEHQHVVINDII